MEQSNQSRVMAYVIGFVSSIVLTLFAYILVVNHVISGTGLVAAIVGLAIIQLFVQLFFFLHLGEEKKPRWNLMALLFAATVVIIVVFGSLWIMSNLNYNMMPNMNDKTDLQDQKGF
jgi:cytochrome o ubiquinol oxidase operon protein cyoD